MVGRSILVGLAVCTAGMLVGSSASAENYVVYLHGRTMGDWPSSARSLAPTGWTKHAEIVYDGNSRINNPTSMSRINATIKSYCSGANQCAILCFSSGCARMLKSFDDLEAAGTPANKIVYIQASGSAAGGSEIANYTSKWWSKLLAKIFGQYAEVDVDMTPARMRDSYGYMQNGAPVAMKHQAGKKDMCMSFLWGLVKLCGNPRLPGGYGDGAVPPHSACGFSKATWQSAPAQADCNAAASTKYTNRGVAGIPNGDTYQLRNVDHVGMIGYGAAGLSFQFGQNAPLNPVQRPTVVQTYANCNISKDDCDAWSDSEKTKTIAELYGNIRDGEGPSSRRDTCLDVNSNGCSFCSEFTVATQAYGTNCNGYKGIEAFTDAHEQSYLTGIERRDSTHIEWQEIGDNHVATLTNGVKLASVTTVTYGVSPLKWYFDGLFDVDQISSTELLFRFVRLSQDAPAYWRYQTLKISGATIVKSKSVAGDTNQSRSVRWSGNQLWFWTHDTGLKKFLLVHPADKENKWEGDPTCAGGIKNGTACCWDGCGSCGTVSGGCAAKPGGAAACCASTVNATAASCSIRSAPCTL